MIAVNDQCRKAQIAQPHEQIVIAGQPGLFVKPAFYCPRFENVFRLELRTQPANDCFKLIRATKGFAEVCSIIFGLEFDIAFGIFRCV